MATNPLDVDYTQFETAAAKPTVSSLDVDYAQFDTPAAPPAPVPVDPAASTSVAGDMGRSLGVGLDQLGSLLGVGMRKVGLEKAGDFVKEHYDARAELLSNQMTPEQQAANATPFLSGDLTAPQSFRKIAGMAAGSAPAMALGMGVGGAATKGLMAAGMRPVAAGIVGGAGGEASVGAGLNYLDVYDQAQSLNMQAVPEYQAALASITEGTDEERAALAREKVATALALKSAGVVGLATGILGAPSGAAFAKLLGGETGKTALRSIGKQAGLEVLQEAPQSVVETYQTGEALATIDPNKRATLGELAESAVSGAIAGGVLGGAMGGVGEVLAPKTETRERTLDVIKFKAQNPGVELSDQDVADFVAGAALTGEAPPAEVVAPDEAPPVVEAPAVTPPVVAPVEPAPELLGLPAPVNISLASGEVIPAQQFYRMLNERLDAKAGGMTKEEVIRSRRRLMKEEVQFFEVQAIKAVPEEQRSGAEKAKLTKYNNWLAETVPAEAVTEQKELVDAVSEMQPAGAETRQEVQEPAVRVQGGEVEGTTIYRGVTDPTNPSQAGVGSKGIESGNFWSKDQSMADFYAGATGAVETAVLPPTAKVLDLETPEGQQVYEALTNRAFDPMRVTERGIDELTPEGTPLADALKAQGYDAVHSVDMDGSETLVLNPEALVRKESVNPLTVPQEQATLPETSQGETMSQESLTVPTTSKGKFYITPTIYTQNQWKPVEGEKVTLTEMPETEFFAYKSGKGWEVAEVTTGASVGKGATKQAAVAAAQANITTITPEKTRLAMSRAEKAPYATAPTPPAGKQDVEAIPPTKEAKIRAERRAKKEVKAEALAVAPAQDAVTAAQSVEDEVYSRKPKALPKSQQGNLAAVSAHEKAVQDWRREYQAAIKATATAEDVAAEVEVTTAGGPTLPRLKRGYRRQTFMVADPVYKNYVFVEDVSPKGVKTLYTRKTGDTEVKAATPAIAAKVGKLGRTEVKFSEETDPVDALTKAIAQETGQPVPLGTFTQVAPPKGQEALFAALSQTLKKDIVFFRAVGAPMTFNGVTNISEGVIYVNIDSAKPHLVVAGHEFLHDLKREDPETYAALRDVVMDVIPEKRRLAMWMGLNNKRIREGRGPIGLEGIDEELVADFFGEQFTSKEFWAKVERRNPEGFAGLVQRLVAFLEKIKAALTGAQREDIERAQTAAAEALARYVKSNPQTEGLDAVFSEFTGKTIGEDGRAIILVDPTKAEMRAFLNATNTGRARVVKDPATGTVYVADAGLVTHDTIAWRAGVPWDSIMGDPAYMFFATKNSIDSEFSQISFSETPKKNLQALKDSLLSGRVTTQALPAVLKVTPLSIVADLADAAGLPWVRTFYKATMQRDAVSNGIVTDFGLLGKELARTKETTNQVAAVADVASIHQMRPQDDIYSQDWIAAAMRGAEDTKPETKESLLKGAQTAWEAAGMQASTGKTFREAYQASRQAFDALPEELQDHYLRAVEMMKDLRQREKDAAQALIEEYTQDNPGLRAEQIAQLDLAYNNLKGNYWPVYRKGDYTLDYVETATDLRGYSTFDTVFEREVVAKSLVDAGLVDPATFKLSKKADAPRGGFGVPQGYNIALGRAIEEKAIAAATEGIDPKDTQALEVATAQARQTAQETIQTLHEVWLRFQPEASAAKNMMRRKNIKGYDGDMVRGFLEYGQTHAVKVAQMEQGRRIERTINDMAAAIRGREGDTTREMAILNDLRAREAVKSQPSHWLAKKLGVWTTFKYMTSPSIALVQMTQLGILTLPKLATLKGSTAAKAAAALSRGTQAAFSTKFTREKMYGDTEVQVVFDSLHEVVTTDLRQQDSKYVDVPLGTPVYTPQELQALIDNLSPYQQQLLALQEAMDRGLLDISLAHEVNEQVERKEMNPVAGKVFDLGMTFMRESEKASRKAAILAAFEVGGGTKDFFAGMETVAEVVDNTLFNYSKSAKGVALQGDLVRVLTTFQTFRINAIGKLFVLFRQTIKGESAEVRTAAKRELIGIFGMSGVLAGALGMPLGPAVFALFDAIVGDDDDEPSEEQFRKWLAENFGQTAADVVVEGVPSLLGASLSRRIGLGDVVGTSAEMPARLVGDGAFNWLATQAMGPSYSMLAGYAKGYNEIFNEGEVIKGLISSTPKPIGDALKAYGFATDGVKTGLGKRLLKAEEVDANEVVLQAFGFAPLEISRLRREQYDLGTRSTKLSMEWGQIKQDLVRAYVDGESTEDGLAKMREFMTKHPGLVQNAGGEIRSSLREYLLKDLGVDSRREMLLKR